MTNRWTPLHSKIISDFFSLLDKNNIEWLVIRNYEQLPTKNNSNDVDIAIKKKDWKISHTLLCNTVQKYGFEYYELKKYLAIQCYTFFNLDGYGFKIDFFDCNEYRGLITHSFEDLYSTKIISETGVNGSSKLHNAAIILLRPLFGGSHIKKKYIPEITAYFKNHPDSFFQELNRITGKKNASLITDSIENENLEEIVFLRKKLIVSILLKNLRKNPLLTLYRIFSHYYFTAVTRIISIRTIPFVAVLGPDGSGKTTFIENTRESIAFFYSTALTKTNIIHHRPTLLPNLGAVGESSGLMKEDKDFTNPHRAKPAGFISSFVRMTYYWLDYFIGVPLKLRKDVQFDRFTIYDRYIYDFLIDPYRSRINLPYSIRRMFTRLVLQPRIVFILLADAKTIYNRKQELTIEEIERQLLEFKKLAKTHSRFVVIDAAQTPEKMVEQAMKVILNRLTNKLS